MLLIPVINITNDSIFRVFAGGGGASEIREGHLRLDSGARPRRTSEPEGHLSLLHRFSTKRFFLREANFFVRSEFFRVETCAVYKRNTFCQFLSLQKSELEQFLEELAKGVTLVNCSCLYSEKFASREKIRLVKNQL